MSEFREIRNLPPLRPILETREDVQLAIQEISVSLGEFANQWNDCIYQLLGSLPGGRVRKAAQDRSQDIEPIQNGFDGSQVFLDQTARPGDLGGVLHTGLRPKTIKEVILQTTQALGGRLNRVERLLEDLEAASGSQYDDSQLRNWLLRLTAETWDPDAIDQGDTVNTGNFAGAPVKSSEYSLAQRDVNLRHLLGIEALSQGLRDLTEVSAISGANYISEDEDIITALLTLDAEINSIVVGSTDLQEAYDNTAAGKEIDVADEPIHITVSGTGETALRLTGRLVLEADFASVSSPLISLAAEGSGTSVDGYNTLDIDSSGGDKLVSFSHRKGSGVGSAIELTGLWMSPDSPNSEILFGVLESEYLRIGNYSGAGNGNVIDTSGDLNISVADGDIVASGDLISLTGTAGATLIIDANGAYLGGDAIEIESTNGNVVINADGVLDLNTGSIDADADTIELRAVTSIELATGSAGLLFNADAFMEGDGVTITATADDVVISSAAGAIDILAVTGLDLDGDTVTIDSVVNTVVTAGGLIGLIAGAGVVITGDVDVSLTSTTTDINLTAGDDINLSATDNIVIEADDDVFVLGGEAVVVANEDWAIKANDGGALAIAGLASVFNSSGITFGTAATITAGVAAGGGVLGGIKRLEDGYRVGAGEASGLQMEVGSYRATNFAPTTLSDIKYGESVVAGEGKPDIDTIYKENIVKAKCCLSMNRVAVAAGITMIPQAALLDGYNFFINALEVDPDADSLGSWWGANEVNMKFLTPMLNNDYAISITIEAKPSWIYVAVVVEGSCSVNGFKFRVLGWNVGTSTDWGVDSSTGNTKVHIQVV